MCVNVPLGGRVGSGVGFGEFGTFLFHMAKSTGRTNIWHGLSQVEFVADIQAFQDAIQLVPLE